ncbi:hypothetical protein SKAU_G00324430 [Synaphobranchus kaupii]|uniref:Uncharacterized protein n=1 Tax=Synaphobranchus kaupii TaxID=118154 RepID=A0A9Q1EPA4_SYNKA|nr:hypothetical protein SKAU_G00324430 [Synaphobranchus kaupii]
MAMAAAAGVGELQKELICPICLDFFDDPVILKCGHNFCRGCILMHWEEDGDDDVGYRCPECRQVFGKISFTTNYLVKNLVDKLDGLEFLRSGNGKPPAPAKPSKLDGKCDKHGEELKLYCHTDSKPICVVCRESRSHRHHDVAPLPEVVEDLKGELRLRLIKLTWQKSVCERVKATDEAAKTDAKRRKQDLKAKIENDIGALVQFLLDEKDDVMASLDAEEVATVAMIDENLKDVSKEMTAVDKAITDIQNHLSGKTTFQAINQTVTSPFQVCSSLQATNCPPNWEEFTGPLQLIMWKKMMHVLHTVPANLALDMDTAHHGLQISDFDTKFSSGQHYWEVDVRDKGVWYLGVTTEYSNRKGYVNLSPSAGYWSLCLQDRLYANEEDARLSLADYWGSPRMGVYLDYDRGRVSFYDAVTMKHVYTFDAYFDEPVFPFFSPGKNDPGSRLQVCHYY